MPSKETIKSTDIRVRGNEENGSFPFDFQSCMEDYQQALITGPEGPNGGAML